MSMNRHLMLGFTCLCLTTIAKAQITFYEGEGYRGRTFETIEKIDNLKQYGFNDRASSVIVENGRWEVCGDSTFRGRCVVLARGNYDNLAAMGLNDRISSVRPAGSNTDNDVMPPPSVAAYEFRRRPNERLEEVPVKTVRAVVGAPTERCWVERQQMPNTERGEPNVGGAIAGALLGGILGHQVGGGVGKDIATVGGAVAGGAIGSNVGRNNQTTERDVRRCENIASQTPTYWDVTYDHRGQEHRVQMTSPPGTTISVNRNGEPRQ